MARLKVLLVDDHTLMRQGLKALLERDFNVIGAVADGNSAILDAREQRPDIVIISASLNGLSALETVRAIRDALPKSKAIFLSFDEGCTHLAACLSLGASGYILRGDTYEQLRSAVSTASRGGRYFSEAAMNEVVAQARINIAERHSSPLELTPREDEILRLLALQKSSKEISVALNISVHTVKTHRSALMRKLGLHSQAEVVAYAAKKGLVNLAG